MKRLLATELFSSGTWNGNSFSTADLDSIVNSFVALSLSGRVPLKLSHDGPDARDEIESKYALGWVTRLWREGDKLLGDLEVPDKVASAISEGYLKFVSVELLRNVKADTRTIPWVLDAVALLGADQPAVGILKELRAVMARGPSRSGYSGGARLAFKREDKSTTGDISTMTEAEEKELRDKLAAALRQNTEQKAEFDRKETERVQNEGKARRTKVVELFDKAVKDGFILPNVRENFLRNASPPEGDARWASFDIADAQRCIDENPKDPKKKFGRQNAVNGEGNTTDEDGMPEGLNASQKVVFKANRQCDKLGIDRSDNAAYDNVVKSVLQSDPKLSEAYRNFALGDKNAA